MEINLRDSHTVYQENSLPQAHPGYKTMLCVVCHNRFLEAHGQEDSDCGGHNDYSCLDWTQDSFLTLNQLKEDTLGIFW